jgi:hypothetical protein
MELELIKPDLPVKKEFLSLMELRLPVVSVVIMDIIQKIKVPVYLIPELPVVTVVYLVMHKPMAPPPILRSGIMVGHPNIGRMVRENVNTRVDQDIPGMEVVA